MANPTGKPFEKKGSRAGPVEWISPGGTHCSDFDDNDGNYRCCGSPVATFASAVRVRDPQETSAVIATFIACSEVSAGQLAAEVNV